MTREQIITRLKELNEELKPASKALGTCRSNLDKEGELEALREFEDIAKAMAYNITKLEVLDNASKKN
jgi:hypothetical protein